MNDETDDQAWKRRGEGSLRWFTSMSGGRSKASDLTPEVLDSVRALRERIRREGGGGGLCHVVSEELQSRRGWERVCVGYLSTDGGMVCASHYVCVLGDGTIVDSTADQFGEGHDVRVVHPGDPEYGRYRPDFSEDYHPGLEPVHLAAWLPDWKGLEDFDAQDADTEARGPAWWLEDTTALLAYLEEQAGHARAVRDRGRVLASTLADIEAVSGRGAAPGMSPRGG